MMRTLAALLAIAVLAGCSTAAVSRNQAISSDAPVGFLLTSAATDFHDHRPPYPLRVRDVHVGYAMMPDATKQYLLCGSFLAEGSKAEWTPFVTIKTSGYEQWLGAQAATFCRASEIVWLVPDVSAQLQKHLDALR